MLNVDTEMATKKNKKKQKNVLKQQKNTVQKTCFFSFLVCPHKISKTTDQKLM